MDRPRDGERMALTDIPPAGRCKKPWKYCARGEKPPTVHDNDPWAAPRNICKWCKKSITKADLVEYEGLLEGANAPIWIRTIMIKEWP